MSSQWGASVLDACVLAKLQKEDTYGYVLTQAMKEALSVSESTMYPVLRRLKKEGYLKTYDEPYQGRNRRYYSLTEAGVEKYEEYKTGWIEYRGKMDQIMLGGEGND